MDGISVQSVSMLSLFVGNIFFGLLPLFCTKWLKYCRSSEHECYRKVKCASFLLYFGGGIFMSNSFLVLLPQARREFDNYEDHSHEGSGASTLSNSSSEASGHHHGGFPIPEFVLLCSFFLAYVLQELTLFVMSKFDSSSRETRDQQIRFCSCAKRHTECSRTYKDLRPDQTLFGMEKQLMESVNEASSGAAMGSGLPDVPVTAKSDLLRSSIISQAVPNYGTVTNTNDIATDNPLPVLAPPVLLAEERRLTMEHLTAIRDHNKLLVTSTLIIIALTVQYIFLGIALGLLTLAPINWPHLVVVFLQNCILTFSAGSDLATSNIELTSILVQIVLLSIMCPVGMIITMLKTNSIDVSHTAKATVAAVVCGVLLYAAFYEMLKKKTLECVTGLTKFTAVILGACIMAALQYAIVKL